MKALRFHRYGPPDVLVWEEVPDPSPRRGQVRVAVAGAGLNPKDVLTRKGKLWFLTWGFPQRTGQDLAGIVDAVGKGVRRFREGEAVYGMLGGVAAGACAERCVIDVDAAALAPRSIPLYEAASLPLAGMTALQALRDDAKVRPGESVVLNGASGGVGVHAIQIAKILGAHVTAVCSTRNVDFVRDLGADEVLPYDEAPLVERDRRFDVVFDIFGTAPFAEARRNLAPGGRYVTTLPRPDTLARDLASRWLHRPNAFLVLVRPRARDLATLAQWVDEGRLRVVIDRVLPIERAAEAHAYLETRRARGKVVLRVGDA